MKTIKLEIDGRDPIETALQAREKVMQIAESMGLPPEALEALKERIDETADSYLRDGPRRLSAQSIVGLLKETHGSLDLGDGFIGLAKKAGEPTAFALGMVCADVESARYLIEASRNRLRDMLDSGVFDKKKTKPEPEPEKKSAEPAEAAAQA